MMYGKSWPFLSVSVAIPDLALAVDWTPRRP